MASAIVGWIVPAGQPRTGLWCPACALPSGIELTFLVMDESGFSPFAIMRRCLECAEPIPAD